MYYSILDCETTGFNIDKHEIVELTIVKTDRNFNIVDELDTLIKPSNVNVKQTDIHGLNDLSVKTAPSFKQLTPEILNILQDTIIVAHGLHFDEEFIQKELNQHRKELKYSYSFGIGICTKTLASRTGHKLSGLDNLAEQYHLEREGKAHSSWSDTMLTLQLAEKLKRKYPEDFEGHKFRYTRPKKMDLFPPVEKTLTQPRSSKVELLETIK